jgi:putative tryptophan/tyrosine transport system substrate-binding protein
MRRREFITLLGSAAATWPLAARAQQATKLRRIGVLQALAADDAESSRRFTAFVQGLQELGWAEGRNMRIDVRWGAGDAGRIRDYAAELVALAPDVIFVIGGGPLVPLQQATRTVPIVFALISDPVGAGFVESLARPGGNITGFGFSNSVPAGNGWSCSKRWRRASHAWPSFEILPSLPGSAT